ncbi:cytochrome P450 4C1-like [Macrosteles quadrilineatus]|uniref:cytochrome P450 4C1-like n=1 Tax=Macrosteles quadrilineatus TaxID=74068 RepID=UPI0023E2EC40|nr:cytochrome P450 4C1-like [Macrosteles quadrilineatus]
MESYQVPTAKAAPAGVASSLTMLAVFCSLAYLAMFKWKRRRLEKLGSQLPGPPALPIIGNGLEFVGDPEDVMNKVVTLTRKFESPFRIWIGPILFVVISKPDDLQIVLNSSKTLAKDPLYRFFRNTVGTGLFSAPVEKWKRNRRAITPAFNMRLLEQFIPVFNDQNRVLVEKMSKMVDLGMFDVWDFVSPATLDIICQTAMGVDVKAQDDPNSDFARALPRASELDYMRIYKMWLHPDFIFNRVSYAEELRHVYKQLHGLPNSVIQQKKEAFRKKKEESMNKPECEQVDTDENKNEKKLRVFLDILLELKDSGTNFSDDDLRDEVVTMMIGGSETSGLTNCFCLLMLAMHQDIQKKVYEEVYNIFGDSDRGVTMEDLNQMTYMEMVIKETLRRFPVGPLFLRKVIEDIEITNYTLPQGCSIVIAPLSTHMNTALYPDPEKFDPERFTAEAVAARHRYAYIPFSGGPRGCIGSKYAMLSMKTTISAILRSYKLFTDIKMEDIKLKIDLLMRSVNGFPIRLERRKSEFT